MPSLSSEQFVNAAKIISKSRHLVVFTGAGISTPSGIPDFRSQGTGLWQKEDPMQVASATAFHNHPDVFYNWLRPLVKTANTAQPNPAHLALADLEKMKVVRAVITQNIDGLHQKAGSTNVIELHGSLQTFYCPKCRNLITNTSEVIAQIISGSIPRCKRCASIIKPGITLYEELLPDRAWNDAEIECHKADVMLIAGSSLEVTPAASLPYAALRHGCKLIIVNLSPTYLDEQAELIIPVDVAYGIPEILNKVKQIQEIET